MRTNTYQRMWLASPGTKELLRQKKITRFEFLLLCRLNSFPAKKCFPGSHKLAEELGVKPQTIKNTLSQLYQKEILVWKIVRTKKGKRRYLKINWPNKIKDGFEFYNSGIRIELIQAMQAKQVSASEIVLLLMVDDYVDATGLDCFVSNKELAIEMQCSVESIKQFINRTRKKELLILHFEKNQRYLRTCWSRIPAFEQLRKQREEQRLVNKTSTDLVNKTSTDLVNKTSTRYSIHKERESSESGFLQNRLHNGSSSMPFFDEPSIEDFDLKIARQLMKFSKEQRWLTAKELKEKSQSKIIAQLRRNLVRSKLRNKNKDSITLDLKVDLNTVAQEEIKQVVDFVCSDKRHLIKKNFRIPSAQSLINSWDSWKLLEHAKKNKPVEISSEAKSIFKRLINYHVWNQFEEQELLTAVQLSLDRYSKLISLLKRRKDEFSKRMIVMLLSYFSIERWWQDWSDWLNKLKDKGESFNGKVSSLVFSIKSERFKKFSSDDPTRFDHKQWYSLLKEISHEED